MFRCYYMHSDIFNRLAAVKFISKWKKTAPDAYGTVGAGVVIYGTVGASVLIFYGTVGAR